LFRELVKKEPISTAVNFVYITKNPPCPEGIAKRSDLVLSGETGGLNDRDGETPADGIEHKMEQVELDQVEVCK
tara:strand:+ start:8638 stop:8859 length:222 start_codon:yes stop_codon:yes gene_type:complete